MVAQKVWHKPPTVTCPRCGREAQFLNVIYPLRKHPELVCDVCWRELNREGKV